MTEKKTFNINFLRRIALTFVTAGAILSLFFMLNAGSNQKSILLTLLFTGWTLLPFVGFFLANKVSTHWTITARTLLFWLMIILTIISLVAYSGALNLHNTKLTLIFLIVPLISLLFIIIGIIVARKLSHKK